MIDLNRILVATDLSENSDRAIEMACELSRRFQAELHLFHVFQPSGGLHPMPDVSDDVALQLKTESPLARAEQYLNTMLKSEEQEGLEVRRHVAIGDPVEITVRYAESSEIDLIVVGTHGFSGLTHLLLGSIAEEIVQKAPCPVLTVRNSSDADDETGE